MELTCVLQPDMPLAITTSLMLIPTELGVAKGACQQSHHSQQLTWVWIKFPGINNIYIIFDDDIFTHISKYIGITYIYNDIFLSSLVMIYNDKPKAKGWTMLLSDRNFPNKKWFRFDISNVIVNIARTTERLEQKGYTNSSQPTFLNDNRIYVL